ncbi:alpha/beta hydrolase [Rheinheimera sp.]|uniref:alpha/beta fold hydrolase n=1 Tax=Rheinheimera sp. TaxID=1869214 RepID=UPI00307D08F9
MAAEVVLLVRGLVREKRHWLNFPSQAAQQLNVPVLTLDVPGCGALCQQPSPLSIGQMRQQLQQQFVLQFPQHRHARLHLCAISMGGMLALDWAVAAPAQVASLVLMNSSSALSPFWQRLRPAQYFTLLRSMLSRQPEQREALIWQLTSNQPLQPEVIQQWVQIARENPVSAANAARQLWAAARFRPIAKPQCPVLVLVSQADRLVDWRCSERLANWLGAEVQLHSAAGHDLPLDDAAWLLAQLKLFYSKVKCGLPAI